MGNTCLLRQLPTLQFRHVYFDNYLRNNLDMFTETTTNVT